MQSYADDGDVFIRSMAARGHAGGLASTSAAAAAVLDAAGFDLVLIETVGTGQSEVEVAAAADTTVVLEAPEMGDEVQAIKAGLLEVADIVVVNKGDRPGAQRTAAQLRAMLVRDGRADGRASEGSERPRPKRPEVLITTASTGEGVPELLAAWIGTARPAGPGPARRPALARAEAQVWAILADRFAPAAGRRAARAATDGDRSPRSPTTHLDPYAAADRLLGGPARLDGASAMDDDDRAGLRRRRRADGPRHRPGPRGDRVHGAPSTSRTSREPRPAGTGSPATSNGRSRRAG